MEKEIGRWKVMHMNGEGETERDKEGEESWRVKQEAGM